VSWLVEPFEYAFFTRALLAGIVIGGLCGAIGVFVVLRRMSYIGHGLAHSVIGGVAVAVVLDVDMYWGAATATLLSAVLIDRIARRRGLHADAAIGIVTTAMFAIGVAVISVTLAVRVNLESLLFGNVLGLRYSDVILAVAIAAVVAALLVAFYKSLVFVLFDPTVASAQGVRVAVTETVFNLLICGVVVASVRVLGVLLIAAAVVVPAAFARLLCTSFNRMFAVSTVTGSVVGVVGLYLSYHWDVPSGPAIVLTGTALFAVAALATATATTVRRRRARHQARHDHADQVGSAAA
jgi:ABC-type Mn2+/Zn2+ transport system permease subunit